MSLLYALFCLTLWSATTHTTVDKATSDTCSQIKKAMASMLQYPGAKAYKDETANYWSQAMMDQRPACIAMPITAEGVSAVVKILSVQTSVKFAVKWSSAFLGQHEGATYDAEKDVTYVKPSGKWKDVVAPLAQYKKTVVGGRLDIVGVGGYMTGGGLSFLSAQYGLAADTVTDFETVMSNGSIVNVNAKNNKDLLIAMRGGGNQYGIVTKFTMNAVPMGKVWGGPIVFTGGKRDALLDAFHDFTETPADPKAAVILTLERVGGQEIYILYRSYDGPVAPPGAFKKFENISSVPGMNFGATRTYPELLKITAFDGDSLPYGRMSFRMMTLLLLPGQHGISALKEATATWFTETKKFQDNNLASVASFALQSFPSLIGKATAKTEGNAMGLTADDGPRFMIEMTYVANGQVTDQGVWNAGRNVVANINKAMKPIIAKVRAEGASKAIVEQYNPLFLNDAAFDQDVYSTYKDFKKFKALQKQVDPEGLWFGPRTGGFKFKQ